MVATRPAEEEGNNKSPNVNVQQKLGQTMRLLSGASNVLEAGRWLGLQLKKESNKKSPNVSVQQELGTTKRLPSTASGAGLEAAHNHC
jgi:hypothetical protein